MMFRGVDVDVPEEDVDGGVNCWVEIVFRVFPRLLLKKLMPSWFSLLRSTLIKRTLRRICESESGTLTSSKLITLPAVEAILTARWELLISLTVPRRKMLSFSELSFNCCPGSSALSSRRIPSMLSLETSSRGRTVTLKNCRPPRVSQIIRLVSPAALPVTMTSVGLVACTSAVSLCAMATRLMGHAQSTRTVLPMVTKRSLAESCMEAMAG